MWVYVLTSEHRVEGVYSTEEKANEAEEILGIDGELSEMEIDEVIMNDWDGRIETKHLHTRKL